MKIKSKQKKNVDRFSNFLTGLTVVSLSVATLSLSFQLINLISRKKTIGKTKKDVVKEYSSSEASASSSGDDDEEEEVEYEDVPLTEKEKNEISAKILRAELMGDDVCYLLKRFCYAGGSLVTVQKNKRHNWS